MLLRLQQPLADASASCLTAVKMVRKGLKLMVGSWVEMFVLRFRTRNLKPNTCIISDITSLEVITFEATISLTSMTLRGSKWHRIDGDVCER